MVAGTNHPARTTARTLSSPGFVGRRAEAAEFAAALARPPTVILVRGEAGVGKSRLVWEYFSSRPDGTDAALLAACPPYRDSLTLGPILDAIRHTGRRVDGLPLSGLAGALRPVFPEWAPSLPPALEGLDDARASRHRLFRALVELLACLQVSVLVLEDVHWADEATLEFILYLASRQPSYDLSLVVTYRPEELAPGSSLRQLSSRGRIGVTQARIDLTPLDLGETADLISSMLGGDQVSQAFVAYLHDRTDGLPFAVEETMRLLKHRADLVYRDGEWKRRDLAELQVPPTVRDLVLERVHRLSDDAQRVLEAAAVLGETAEVATLTTLSALSNESLRQGLGEAIGAGLLSEPRGDAVAFRHALMGTALYEQIPGPDRRHLHRRAGEILERANPVPVAQLARHFREAGDLSKWSSYAEQAADLAIGSDDHNAAVLILIDLINAEDLDAPIRLRLACTLATAAASRRDAVDQIHEQVISTIREVLASDREPSGRRAELRSVLGRLLFQQGNYEAGCRELEGAVTGLPHSPRDQARAMTYLGLPLMSDRPAATHRKWLARAAAISENVSLSATDRLSLTIDQTTALLHLGDGAGWRMADRLAAGASGAEEQRQLARGTGNVAVAAIVWGRYSYARRQLNAALTMADGDLYPRVRMTALVGLANLDLLTGSIDGLRARVEEWHSSDDLSRQHGLSVGLLAARLRAARDGGNAAEPLLGRALEVAYDLGMTDDVLAASACLARLRLNEGRLEDAIDLTTTSIQSVCRRGLWIWSTEIAQVWVDALVGAGRVEEATRFVSMFARGLRGCDAPAPRAALAVCRAAVLHRAGVAERAARSYARAANAWDRLPRPYDAWLARERQARCLIAAGEVEAAVPILTATVAGLAGLDARADASRVIDQLHALGTEVRRPWRGGRRSYGDELSPREREVVRLVAEGSTNREIADALSRSPSTVSTQLSSAMRKMGVNTRTALAVAAIESLDLSGD